MRVTMCPGFFALFPLELFQKFLVSKGICSVKMNQSVTRRYFVLGLST